MKIGIITYRNYDERVLLDRHFDPKQLMEIALTDKDFKHFGVIDEQGNTILTTNPWGRDKEGNYLPRANYISFVKIERHEEILSTTYNAFAKNPYKHKKKVTWGLSNGGYLNTKKGAQAYADLQNDRALYKLEALKEIHTTA